MLNIRNYRIGHRLISTTIGALALMIAFVVVALIGLGMVNDRVQTIAVDGNQSMELAYEMQGRLFSIGQHANNAMLLEEIARQRQAQAAAIENLESYHAGELRLSRQLQDARAQSALKALSVARQDGEASLTHFFGLIQEGNRPEIEQFFADDFQPKMLKWQDQVGVFLKTQKSLVDAAMLEIEEIGENVRLIFFSLIALSVVVMIPSGIWVTRQITRPLQAAVDIADSVAAGNFENQVDLSGRDETAHLLQTLSRMQADLKFRTERDKEVAAEAMRIKVALDVGSNCVMLADNAGKIIYCNSAALSMMRNAESDLRKALPDFKADEIVGSNFDIYHRNASHQRNLLAALNAPLRSQINVGGRTFSLVATPVLEAGVRLGTVVEWLDRTGEVAIEQEVSEIIEAAVVGDFSRRIVTGDKQGFFLRLSNGINGLLDANGQALDEIGKMLARLAAGDLTQRIDIPYQGLLAKVRDDANGTVDNLRAIVSSIKEATDAINTAASEIAMGNQDLSGRTEQQASSLEETASSMEQLTSTVQQNAVNASRANALAATAQKVAEQGGSVFGDVVSTMGAIQQSSNRIADIIGVIDGIAFQTNILALNAAVEAARAGEQGRGFAVVATEVRSLAQRSASAAKEIKSLIADSVDKVATGHRLVDQAGTTMGEVVASIQRVAHLMADISSASTEQSAGIAQVGLAITQMDEVTQQNAALVEQAAAAAESLQEQARCLADAVSVFRVTGDALILSPGKVVNGSDFMPTQAMQDTAQPKLLAVKTSNKMISGRVPRLSDRESEWAEF